MEDYLNLAFRLVLRSQVGADYTCLQRLGTGGTAETYLMLAVSGPLRGQLFAVKVFRRLSKPDWRANFLDEIKFLQGCDHPAVMRVFDEGLYLEKHPFVVAEYLPGTLVPHRLIGQRHFPCRNDGSPALRTVYLIRLAIGGCRI